MNKTAATEWLAHSYHDLNGAILLYEASHFTDTISYVHLTPIPFMVRSMKLSSLFAGKLHAVLCRGWKNRPKGRDWYDMVWYVQNGYEVNLTHLATRLTQSCKALAEAEIQLPKTIQEYTSQMIVDLLKKRIESLDIDLAKQDVCRFIYDEKELNIWRKDFFLAIIQMLKFK